MCFDSLEGVNKKLDTSYWSRWLQPSVHPFSEARAGLHDNVPDRPTAKVAPVGCQLATMALKIKTVTIP